MERRKKMRRQYTVFSQTRYIKLSCLFPLLIISNLKSCLLLEVEGSSRSFLLAYQATTTSTSTSSMIPSISPATKLHNQIYKWRGQNIRYQVSGPKDGKPVLLIHGLFVNSDHWRKTLKGLEEHGGYRTYAMDLLGYGYSSKPPRNSPEAIALCGENARFVEDLWKNGDIIGKSETKSDNVLDEKKNGGRIGEYADRTFVWKKNVGPSVLKNVRLGTADGRNRIADVDLRHPLKSCYNFYTWSEQIADFTRDVIHATTDEQERFKKRNDVVKTSLVSNSIGTISSLQSIIDHPTLFDGIFVVNPNFRELHVSEVAYPKLSMPLVRYIQGLLRSKGQWLYDKLATPNTVAQILREPYKIVEAVDDELVNVLLEPLLIDGASDVVFDTLSYSAGPLPEQQLQSVKLPVWVCYGTDDPWTPPKRVERLIDFGSSVERIIPLDGIGHCPHDEAPELVNPQLLDFLERVHCGTEK